MNNVVDTYISFTKTCIENYSKEILQKYYIKDVFDVLLKAYVSTFFYDYYDNIEGLEDVTNKQYLKSKKDEVFNDTLYYKDEIDINYQGFVFAIELAELNKMDDVLFKKISEYKIKVLNIKEKDNLNDLIMTNISKKNLFFEEFETHDFYLDYIKTNIIDLYDTTIKHNIKFSEIYSDLAIEKAFSKDLINEQKMFVYYYLLSIVILKSIIKKENDKEYLMDFDYTVLEKEKKIKRLLNVIANDALKEKMYLKITYSNYLLYEKDISNLLKNGYKFAIIIDDKYPNNDNSRIKLNMFDYIIITNKKYYYDSFNSKTNIVKLK